ncbi:unnamed protein product [Haemonchus placei]|uniref:Otopetrin-2 n=1 Tax=Haemonchus placei TaxID=6290 RepID=A0A158QPA4_HAEPC|nr:unnamed protein product [Haemonchus placei]
MVGSRKMQAWLSNIHHICTVLLYAIFQLSLFMNLYVLLSREDTIFYLRLYHLIIALLMFCCGLIEVEFLIRTRKLEKLEEPHEIPVPALIGAVALTIGIVLGYLYFIIFNYAFQNCDKLVDAIYSSELWLESCYDVLMAAFSALSLVYILQRRYYGAINSNLDNTFQIGRLFINITFSVVWIKVVVYKGYLSHQELCQRKELESYWCPVMRRNYECSPANDLHGTQKMWYYINKGVLSSSIISCASEFFPVLLVAHWLACGGAEEKAEDIQRRVRGLMREFLKDISRVYTANTANNSPPLVIRKSLLWFFWVAAPITSVACAVRWMVYFYWTIDFDHLMEMHWATNDYVSLVANILQLILFIAFYVFARGLSNDRLDAHHKAHARGDIAILFGCCVILFVKFILQSIEVEFQRKDGFVDTVDAITHALLFLFQTSQWLQYLSMRRILAMSDRDCRATKRFLPLVASGGLLMAWIHFGITFFDTSLIKYQLTDETFNFSQTTLVCMIFTQTIFPADYLFAFTVSGCYLELLQRFLSISLNGHFFGALFQVNKRFQNGPNIATMMHAANVMYRKRMESDNEVCSLFLFRQLMYDRYFTYQDDVA